MVPGATVGDGPGGMRSGGKLPFHPAAWLYSLALLPRLASHRSGRGASGCHVVPLGLSRCLVPRPSPSYHVAGEQAGRGPRLNSHQCAAPQLSLTAFNVVRADMRCRLADPRQSDVTSL
jgi:hypothetical protein